MTEEAFIQAIVADPDDDGVRLVYADWLEENGREEDQARVELIRLQCQAEKATKAKRAQLDRKAKAILKANPAWTKLLTKDGLTREHEFRRGFLHHLTMGATRFCRNAKKLFETYPTLRSVRFYEASNEVKTLSKSPFLARLIEADLSHLCHCGGCPIERDIKALIESKFAGNLITLNISKNRMDAAQAAALAKSTAFGALRELDLSNNPIGNDGAEALAASPWMGQLKRLELRECGIDDAMGKVLKKKFKKAVML